MSFRDDLQTDLDIFVESEEFAQFVTLYFKTADYCGKKQRLPVHGEQIWLDGKRYDVESCEDQLGIAKLTLAAYRQNTLRPRPFRGANPYEN